MPASSVHLDPEADRALLRGCELALVDPADVRELREAGGALLAVLVGDLDLVGRGPALAAVGREGDVGVVTEGAAAHQRGGSGHRVDDADVGGAPLAEV